MILNATDIAGTQCDISDKKYSASFQIFIGPDSDQLHFFYLYFSLSVRADAIKVVAFRHQLGLQQE